MASSKGVARIEVESRILAIRGENVMLDSDLARVYGVTTKALNQAVKRNEERFPEDFAFQLTPEEIGNLKSQFVTSSSGHGGRRKPPWVFTEHGAIMAATVLNSPSAVEMSVFVVRAFILSAPRWISPWASGGVLFLRRALGGREEWLLNPR